jgi:hypothetical protein
MFPVSANEVRKCKAFIIYLFIYLFIYLEPLTQLIMQSQPTLMITMAIAVAIHGTTLATLNQMMEQVSDFSKNFFLILACCYGLKNQGLCIIAKYTIGMYSFLEITLHKTFLLFYDYT